MISQINSVIERKNSYDHESIDLFLEAINLIVPDSKINEHSRKIHRSNSVPNDLAGLSSTEPRVDNIKLDSDSSEGINYVFKKFFFFFYIIILGNTNRKSVHSSICLLNQRL